MTVRMGLIKKKRDWTADAFQSYWRDKHGPLAARTPSLREYWQNLVTDRVQRGIDYPRGPWDFDGVSQLWFDDERSANYAFNTSELAAALIKDEQHFLGGLHIVTADQSVVIDVPDAPLRGSLLKRISTLKRRDDVTEADFRREWKVHADYVRKMPGVHGYRQNVIVGRELVKGESCEYGDLPIDGIVEMWFESTESLAAAFSSPAGQVTMNHAITFLAEITALLVEERRVV